MLNNRLDDLYAQLTCPQDYTRRITREYIADWIQYAKNENDEPITAHDWLVDLLFILCDIKKHRVFLTGAAQIAKTLCSVLSTKLLTEHYNKLRIIWIYASREQGDTYPDIQIQPIFKGSRIGRTIKGDRNSRIYIRHANTSVETPSMAGKSLVKSGLSSLTADIAVCDEVSQWRTTVDPSDRVKRSVFESHPIRYYGTPGSGKGIEATINETAAIKISCHATCSKCGNSQRADLYDIITHDMEANGRPYNYKFNNCTCGASKRHLTNWRYYDQDDQVCALWLHPFLHCTTPEQMDKQLSHISTRSLTDQSVANIYQQLLGTINKAGNQAITANELVIESSLPTYDPIATYYGIDQGRKELYLTELLDYGDKIYVNYLNATTLIGARDYILKNDKPSFTVTDFAPDAEAALWLKEQIPHMACALQNNSPTANYDYKLDTAYSNGLPYQVIKFNYVRWVEELIDQVKSGNIVFIKDNISELTTRHLTSVRCITGKVIRPPDKIDDLFFAMMFAMFARTLFNVYNGREQQLTIKEWR